MAIDKITVRGAHEHNLKGIDLDIPRDELVVITGVSGSGKSSLAFDTLYAEGQRRYVESLSPYARQFLGLMEKPDVDLIAGLSPAIAIQQKTGGRNPRSTVATTTEIYDYLRLLYARIGVPHCPQCGKRIARQSVQQITDHILAFPEGTRLQVLAPLVSGRKGEYKKLFEQARKDGFARLRINREIVDLSEEPPALDKNRKHDIEIVVDRLVVKPDLGRRLTDSLETALKHGQGNVKVLEGASGDGKEHFFSQNHACPDCGISLEEMQPRNFSFNNPHGACPECTGMGYRIEVDEDLVVNPEKTLSGGAIEPYASPKALYYQSLVAGVCKHFKVTLDTPFGKLPEKVRRVLLYGTDEEMEFNIHGGKYRHQYWGRYEGVIPNLERRYKETDSEYIREEIEKYMVERACRSCRGARLRKESLAVKVADRNIVELTRLSVKESVRFFEGLKLDARSQSIARQILKEVRERLGFLKDVGLDYISLDRMTSTLSGGEAQRIHLATQIGSALMGVLYILDEPSIGLHQRDNRRLLDTLKHLRDLGNTVIVVEHDEETIEAADHVVDIGPGAGANGGRVVCQGDLSRILACRESLTGLYLSGKRAIPFRLDPGRPFDQSLVLKGVTRNNMKGVDVAFPLGAFLCVTGVSGSGKSSLVMETLYPALRHEVYRTRLKPEGYRSLEGAGSVDKVIEIDQSPIGRTPRSNPATYTGLFTLVRDLFARLPESRTRGYAEGRFSFNVKGGRCETCGGDGVLRIEMHFLPDVYVTCEACKGRRYNRETLEVRYKEKSIADVLDMSAEEALAFFAAVPRIAKILKTLKDVGLGYIRLGQPATTLSGGEAQRVKLSTELARRSTGRTVYILDEPTTGLHFADVHHLIEVLRRLVDAGNTVIVIEHNLDVIKTADHIIDLGPEGGDEGGTVVVSGPVSEVVRCKASHTGRFLNDKIRRDRERNKSGDKRP